MIRQRERADENSQLRLVPGSSTRSTGSRLADRFLPTSSKLCRALTSKMVARGGANPERPDVKVR